MRIEYFLAICAAVLVMYSALGMLHKYNKSKATVQCVEVYSGLPFETDGNLYCVGIDESGRAMIIGTYGWLDTLGFRD